MSKIFIQFSVFSLLVALSLSYMTDYQSIELPIKSKHDIEVIKTPSEESDHATYVDVPGGVLPIYITFKTHSSPVHVKQIHSGTKGSHQKSDSKDEPHYLIHEVQKPVYQEIKEIITPYRKVIQVIEPLKEEILTKVHKGERKSKYGNVNGYGNDYGKGGADEVMYGKSNNPKVAKLIDYVKIYAKEDNSNQYMIKQN